MEKVTLIASEKVWSPERKRYETVKTYQLDPRFPAVYGGIAITVGVGPFYRDPMDNSPSLTLEKIKGASPEGFHIIEMRSSLPAPEEHIVGKTTMKESPISFTDMDDVMGLQIYQGDPKAGHPDMLEINQSQKIGESPASPLL